MMSGRYIDASVNDTSLSDVLYPECHLDSPIVTGKLVSALEYSSLHHNQYLQDDTLQRNIRINKQRNLKTIFIKRQIMLGDYIRKKIHNLNDYIHLPYPECNSRLFRVRNQHLSGKLLSLMSLAESGYNRISSKLAKMLGEIDKQIYSAGENKEENLESHIIIDLGKTHRNSCWFLPFCFWFTVKTEMRNVQKESQKLKNRNESCIVELKGEKMSIIMNPNLVCLFRTDSEGKFAYYLTPEIVLMYSDVLEGRLMIDLAMTSDLRFKTLVPRAYDLWDLIDPLFQSMGNKTYILVSLLEPLSLAVLQLRDQSHLLRGAFLHHCVGDLYSELKKSGVQDEQSIKCLIDRLIEIINNKDIHMVSEFFSFFRTFGHPTLEAENAAKKVREHMLADKIVIYEPIMKAHAVFCGIIINGYRDRHGGAWPPLKLPDHAHSEIKKALHSGEALSHETCIKNWKSFVGIQFGCFMPLALDSDLSMYMKDKALSPIKKEWDVVYPKETMIYRTCKQTSSRRLIDVFIDDEQFDPFNMIEYVLSGDYLRDNDFNVSYSLKEKETKEVGRLFAKMTYKMRACQVIAESLIANGVGQFFKENGTVKTEQDLLKTLYQLSISSVPRGNKFNKSPENKSKSERGSGEFHGGLEEKGRRHQRRFKDLSEVLTFNTVNKKTDITNKKTFMNTIYKRSFTEIHDFYNPAFNNRIMNKSQDIHSKIENESDLKYDTVSAFLTTDMKKFCLNWRYETVAIFAERMNEIYGLPKFFNWMHERLERSVMYVADPNCPPDLKEHIDLDDVPENNIFIKYPKGGIEGYSQKLWTIITIPFLFLSAYETGTRIAAIVQGDNEAIAITKRVHPNLPYRVKKEICAKQAQTYFEKLRENMKALGHELKATETIISTHFFIYSKRIHYDGTILSQSLKTISRCCFWSETLVDETRAACSNISTTIAKSIENGFSKNIGYAINTLKVIQQLVISLKFSINETLTSDVTDPIVSNVDWLVSAALIPSAIGGFNYLNISRIFVRNLGDPVTASFADIKRMIQYKILNNSILQKIMNQDPGESSFLDWANDPYSANIPHSQSITKVIKNITARNVLKQSVNPMLKGLFHDDFTQEDKDLAIFLMDRSRILPRAAHEIIKNSITGAREEIAGLLDTTKGLIRTSLKKGGLHSSFFRKLSNHDYNQFWMLNKLLSNRKTNDLISDSVCSVDLAIALRSHMWRELSMGRPILGLEVPDPLECVQGIVIMDSRNCHICENNNNSYTWFFIPKDLDLDIIESEKPSIRVPYVGSTTEERSEIKLGNIKSASKALKSAIRIATVYTWAYGADEISWYEAWYLASQRANITLEVLKAVTPISTSSNISHRLRDRSTQVKFSGSFLSRVSKYVSISNDNLELKIDGDKVDTNIIYQNIMLTGLSAIEYHYRLKETTSDTNVVLHLHIIENCCIKEVPVTEDTPSDLPLPAYKDIKENNLIYDSDPIIEYDKCKLEIQEGASGEVDFPYWSTEELHMVLAQSLALTIIEIINKLDRDVLKHNMAIESDDSINSLITEFLIVDPELFSYFLGQNVAIKWAFEVHFKRPKGRVTMVETLADLLNDVSTHVYRVLANALSHPRILKRFIERGIIIPNHGPYLHQQNFNELARELIITSYSNYLRMWVDNKRMPYLIPEQDINVVDLRKDLYTSRHLCIIVDLYCDAKKPPWIADLNSQQKIALLQNHIDECRILDDRSRYWNVESLEFDVYPTSTTYLRRGIIKQLRIREANEVIDMTHLSREDTASILSEISLNPARADSLQIAYLNEILETDLSVSSVIRSQNFNYSNHENHRIRRIGINSTSCYKAISLSHIIKQYEPKDGVRLFVGEGAGSMLITYLRLLGEKKSFYNSGISGDTVPGQRELRLFPSEVATIPDSDPNSDVNKRNIIPIFNGRPETSWIGNLDCFVLITQTLCDTPVSLVHSDMESGIEKDPNQIFIEHSHLIALHINLSSDEGILVSKLAYAYGFPIVSLLRMYRSYYSIVLMLFTAYSNPESTEFYLLCAKKILNPPVSPDFIYNNHKPVQLEQDISITNKILKYKDRCSRDYKKRNKMPHTGLSVISDEYTLSYDEKLLLQAGLVLNGPQILNELSGIDDIDDIGSHKQSVVILLNEALNLFDHEREPTGFLEPYPVLDSSKIKRIMKRVTSKIYCLILMYPQGFTQCDEEWCIKHIRSRKLVLDLSVMTIKRLLYKNQKSRMEKSGFRNLWFFEMSVPEQKKWWKLVGYADLLRSTH